MQIGIEVAQEHRKGNVLEAAGVRPLIYGGMEVPGEVFEVGDVSWPCRQKIFVPVIQTGEGMNQIPDICADTEVPDTPGIDYDS